MITPEDTLSIRQQTALLGVNRSTIYYKKVAPSAEDLMIKKLIDVFRQVFFPKIGKKNSQS